MAGRLGVVNRFWVPIGFGVAGWFKVTNGSWMVIGL